MGGLEARDHDEVGVGFFLRDRMEVDVLDRERGGYTPEVAGLAGDCLLLAEDVPG